MLNLQFNTRLTSRDSVEDLMTEFFLIAAVRESIGSHRRISDLVPEPPTTRLLVRVQLRRHPSAEVGGQDLRKLVMYASEQCAAS